MRTALLGAVAILAACQPSTPHVRESEREIVNRALDLAGEGKVSRAELLKDYDPVVVYLPDKTCVGLNLRPGWAGGDTTMCFDKEGKRLLFTYVNGD